MSGAMSGGRDKIFGAIRAGLGRSAADAGRRETVARRLAGQAPHLVPQRARQDADKLALLFAEQLRAANAVVLAAKDEAELPSTIAKWLRSQNLPLKVRAGSDAWLAGLDWSRERSLTVVHGRAEPADEVGLTHAVAAVAETGTLVLASGPDNPVSVTFLPETSIVVVRAADLVGPYEQAFARLRDRLGRGVMPRTLNLVSGPSRTADVGGRLVTGAHGPRRFCVIVVG